MSVLWVYMLFMTRFRIIYISFLFVFELSIYFFDGKKDALIFELSILAVDYIIKRILIRGNC